MRLFREHDNLLLQEKHVFFGVVSRFLGMLLVPLHAFVLLRIEVVGVERRRLRLRLLFLPTCIVALIT